MREVEISEAGETLADLVELVRSGQDVILAEHGRAVARVIAMVPDASVRQCVQLGRLEDQFNIPDDFDAPLPDDILDLFEGKP